MPALQPLCGFDAVVTKAHASSAQWAHLPLEIAVAQFQPPPSPLPLTHPHPLHVYVLFVLIQPCLICVTGTRADPNGAQSFWAIAPQGSWQMNLPSAGHMSFLDYDPASDPGSTPLLIC